MARKPDILSDRDDWGAVLNDYLDVSLNEDGTLRQEAVAGAGGGNEWRNHTIQVVGDIHVGWTPQARLDDAEADLVASDGMAALRVFIGDLTQTVDDSTQDSAALAFMDASSPSGWMAVIGNHDRQHDSDPTWDSVFGHAHNWYRDISTDLRVIGVSPDTQVGGSPITLSSGTLDWLAARLGETDRQCVICCHAPLTYSVTGGQWGTDSVDGTFFIVNPDADIRAVLAAHPNARAWVSGHTHTPLELSETMVRRVATGTGTSIVAINVGAVAYTGYAGVGTPADPDDALGHPNYSAFISCYDDRIEVRWRDHVTGEWRSWREAVVATAARAAPATALRPSLARPLVLLRPGGSVDADGPLTPALRGTAPVVAGAYGDAWDCAAGGVRVPVAGHIDAERGTLLIRAALGEPTGDRRVLADIGTTTTDTTLLQVQYRTTGDDLGVTSHIGGVAEATAELGSPWRTSHDDVLTYMVRWSGADMDITLDTVDNRATATRATVDPIDPAGYITIGCARGSNRFSTAVIESAVVYDDWITDAEFAAVAALPRAWSWDMLPGAPTLPGGGGSGATWSYPTPLLRLSPDESRDRDDVVVPDENGTVTTTTGDYGTAWVTTIGGVSVPLVATNQRIRADRGTVLVRATLDASPGNNRDLLEIGDFTASYGFFTVTYTSGKPDMVTVQWYDGTTANVTLQLESPYGTSHSDLLTYMLRWNGPDVSVAIGSSADIVSGVRTAIPPFKADTGSLWLGSNRLGNDRWPGTIEDVLIYDRAITNTEFDVAATWPEAWSWRML